MIRGAADFNTEFNYILPSPLFVFYFWDILDFRQTLKYYLARGGLENIHPFRWYITYTMVIIPRDRNNEFESDRPILKADNSA